MNADILAEEIVDADKIDVEKLKLQNIISNIFGVENNQDFLFF